MTTPTIYVACLASYNNGHLYGVHLDAARDADEIREDIATMLRGSPYPNVMVDCPRCDGHGSHSNTLDRVEVTCEECKGSGKVPSAEEYAIHDFENFEGIKLGEYESIEKVACFARCLDQADDSEAFALFVANGSKDCGEDSDDWLEAFRDAYRGTFRSIEDYAEEVISEMYALDKLPDIIRHHIDWEGIARDFEVSGDIWTEAGGDGVYVFDNNV